MIRPAAIDLYARRHGLSYYEAARRLGRAGGKAAARSRRTRSREQAQQDAFRRMREQRPDLYD